MSNKMMPSIARSGEIMSGMMLTFLLTLAAAIGNAFRPGTVWAPQTDHRAGRLRSTALDSLPPRSIALQECIDLANELRERQADRSAPGTQLDDVQAAFTAFAFADERLRRFEPLSQFDLSDASVFAQRTQAFKH